MLDLEQNENPPHIEDPLPNDDTQSLISPNDYPERYPIPNEYVPHALNPNAREAVRAKIKRKIKIYILYCVWSIAKIAVAAVFLNLNERSCDLPLEYWLYLMITHDTILLFCCSLECHSIIGRLNSDNLNMSLNDSSESIFFNPDYIFNERRHQVCSYFSLLKELNKMFYIFLFMWGNMLLFFTESNCGEVSKHITLLVMVFTMMGYIYLFYPILMLISVTVCLPFLIIFGVFFNSDENVPAETGILESLVEKEYGVENICEDECVICKQEYLKEDKIITMTCDTKHYFHSECIKSWLKINGICPICRKKLK